MHRERQKMCVCVRGRVTEQACVSVNEGYVKAISGLFNLSERELAHFHNHHLSFSDSPHFFAEKPTAQNRETVYVESSGTTFSSSLDLFLQFLIH